MIFLILRGNRGKPSGKRHLIESIIQFIKSIFYAFPFGLRCESEIIEKRAEFSRLKCKSASSSSKFSGSRKSTTKLDTTASSRSSTAGTDDSFSSQKDQLHPKEDDVFDYDRDDPNWKTFHNLEWGNAEFEGAVSSVYIPYLMGGA